jgi:leucyl-tRNA synthetase
MMEYVNAVYKDGPISLNDAKTFLLLVSPYAPHVAEELWQRLGNSHSLAYEPWPKYEVSLAAQDQITISVQVNGKLRATIDISKNAQKDEVLATARTHANVAKYLEGQALKKEIYVPGRIVNFVV